MHFNLIPAISLVAVQMITELAAHPFSRSPFMPRRVLSTAEKERSECKLTNEEQHVVHATLLPTVTIVVIIIIAIVIIRGNIVDVLSPTYDDTVSPSFPRPFHFRNATVLFLSPRFSSLGNAEPPRTASSPLFRKISFS